MDFLSLRVFSHVPVSGQPGLLYTHRQMFTKSSSSVTDLLMLDMSGWFEFLFQLSPEVSAPLTTISSSFIADLVCTLAPNSVSTSLTAFKWFLSTRVPVYSAVCVFGALDGCNTCWHFLTAEGPRVNLLVHIFISVISLPSL